MPPHSALLPNYKRLMPTFWVLKNDEKERGVSVFFMDEGIDTGEILVQSAFPIEQKDTLERFKKIIERYDFIDIDSAEKLIDWNEVPIIEM